MSMDTLRRSICQREKPNMRHTAGLTDRMTPRLLGVPPRVMTPVLSLARSNEMGSKTRTVVVGHGVSGAVLRGLNLGLDAKAMFVLEKPQDAFFRLLDGREERILAALEAA